ncbi:MAG: pseudouridine synthase [Pseudomonadota bacterium]
MSADPLPILFADDHIMVVAKPAGLLVHKSNIDFHEPDNLIDRLYRQTGNRVYPVHRLDKPTSGVLLLALHADSARILGQQFEQRTIKKTYSAITRGYTPLLGCIDHPIGDKDRPGRPKTPAVTEYLTLAQIELPVCIDRYPTTRYSLVELYPNTGRRHQIRQHMKHIDHPLIGDTSYGKSKHNRFFQRHFDCHRLLLHATGLTFNHPATGEVHTIHSPPQASLDNGQFARVLNHEHWQAVSNSGAGRQPAQ